MRVLGVSAYFHDAAAALVVDGEVVAAAQEERFSRTKHDPSFPVHAIESCLDAGAVEPGSLDLVAFYEKPLATFGRVLDSFIDAGPRSFTRFPKMVTEWGSKKLWVSLQVERTLRDLGHPMPELVYADHHMSHAAAAFLASPYERATILTLDGVGERTTSMVALGDGGTITPIAEQHFPHSIGLLYSAFTVAAGFRANSGEGKLMGLAPFGEPRFLDAITTELVAVRPDGSIELNLRYFDLVGGRRMTNRRFDDLVGGPPRDPDDPISDRDCDLAASIQALLEDVVVRSAGHAIAATGERNLVFGGGVALNCTANGHLLRSGVADQLWIQPAPGDAGSALGAALWASHTLKEEPRKVDGRDAMRGARLGPISDNDADAVARSLDEQDRPYRRISDPIERAAVVAAALADGAVVGVLSGPMEFGPRALGGRSILADPRSPSMQARINGKVKRREWFRPFAPAVLADRAHDWFDLDVASPYMLFTVPVLGAEAPASRTGTLQDRLAAVTSPLPAVTHVDGTARVQTVDGIADPAFHQLIEAFDRLTGCPVLLNTSFNVRGEPLVRTAEEAYACFMATDLDVLVLEDCILEKADQPVWSGVERQFAPD